MANTWANIKWFKPGEFDSPDMGGSGEHMSLDFVGRLDQLRIQLGLPMHVNSGYRTIAYNKKVGGVPNSAHVMGLAADIACPDSGYRYKLVQLALLAGFKRIGIGSNFVHLDISLVLAQNVIWLYSQSDV